MDVRLLCGGKNSVCWLHAKFENDTHVAPDNSSSLTLQTEAPQITSNLRFYNASFFKTLLKARRLAKGRSSWNFTSITRNTQKRAAHPSSTFSFYVSYTYFSVKELRSSQDRHANARSFAPDLLTRKTLGHENRVFGGIFARPPRNESDFTRSLSNRRLLLAGRARHQLRRCCCLARANANLYRVPRREKVRAAINLVRFTRRMISSVALGCWPDWVWQEETRCMSAART